jgi:hypothetical protein
VFRSADLQVGHVEFSLHLRLRLAGANQISRGAAAHEEADRFDEHRLAGAGFAGEDVQAGLEFDLDGIDDGEVLNAKEAKHLRRPAAP